ncbi:MAG: methanogenesis marker 2 protein [Haliangiales bacterium]
MRLDGVDIAALTAALREQPGVTGKRDIQAIARALARAPSAGAAPMIRNGDDAAAIAHGDGYLLIAAEGMWPPFVQAEPWFAGFCSLMVNISDIAATGGRALAVVDVLFCGDRSDHSQLLAGMCAASEIFQVPIVGGHTARQLGHTNLAVAIIGHAKALITSFDAKPGQQVLAAIDTRGQFRGASSNFDAATSAAPQALRAQLEILPTLAEAGLVRAGKDISMAGIPGTLLMLCEGSGCGAILDLDALPAPPTVDPMRWLTCFPSFGYLLAVDASDADEVIRRFDAAGVACAAAGEITAAPTLRIQGGGQAAEYWDLRARPLTGFGAEDYHA